MFGNWLKTSLLMAAIVALFGTVGALLGGAQGMVLALLLGGAMNLWAYWFSDKMVLRLYNAQEVDETSAPGLYRMVRELADRAGIPMPRVYLIDEDQPNAFATGRNPENAAVAATTGIMRMLTERELRGVMAHEPRSRVPSRPSRSSGCSSAAATTKAVPRTPSCPSS
jgi:heat shock protein HtpX